MPESESREAVLADRQPYQGLQVGMDGNGSATSLGVPEPFWAPCPPCQGGHLFREGRLWAQGIWENQHPQHCLMPPPEVFVTQRGYAIGLQPRGW